MVLDQVEQGEYPNPHERVSLDHFYQILLLLLHYAQQAIQQHNNDVV
jgi:hypothetical protein